METCFVDFTSSDVVQLGFRPEVELMETKLYTATLEVCWQDPWLPPGSRINGNDCLYGILCKPGKCLLGFRPEVELMETCSTNAVMEAYSNAWLPPGSRINGNNFPFL